MSTKIKPFKNEKDHIEALTAIETLFDAKEDTDEANLRDILVLLVEKYEDEFYPMEFPDPVSAIKFRMEQEGLTQKDLVPLIGSRSKVSEVLSGKRELSLKMIRALHKHLGISAEILLQDSSINKIEDNSDVDFNAFPINEMKKYGAFDGLNIKNAEDNAEEYILNLVQRIGNRFALPDFKFRISKSTRLNAKINTYALQGWILHLLYSASKVKVSFDYNDNIINKKFLNSLVNLSVMEEGPELAQEYLLKHGIILVVVHHYKNTYLDGAAYITANGQPVIGLTLRYDRIDNFWFNLLHEIGHIKLHLKAGNYIADDMSLRGSHGDDSLEVEADNFAEEALFSTTFDLDQKDNISRDEVISYAQKNNLHPAIVAGKIQYTKNNYCLLSNMVGRGEVRKFFK